jgi:hypothetical protein
VQYAKDSLQTWLGMIPISYAQVLKIMDGLIIMFRRKLLYKGKLHKETERVRTAGLEET